MIILEIMLIPLLALSLISMVFIVGIAGLGDSEYLSRDDLHAWIDTEEMYPIYSLDYTDSLIAITVDDPVSSSYQ